tara:strand:+ start:532 stop:1068 length:537 start_codon:yes stop_codon:yes gene_type:complete
MELIDRTYSIPLTDCRIWNSGQVLPAAAATDDLGLDFGAGVSATVSPVLSTGDIKAASSTMYAAFPIILPDRYETAKSLTFNIFAGAKTTISDTSLDLDLQVFLSDGDGTANADIISTAAQSINSLTEATFAFAATETGLSAGNNLWGLLSITYVDASTATAVIGQVGKIDLVATCRG